jgi:NADP-dependent 3-hydroxy acid dehydrogenase YdfG
MSRAVLVGATGALGRAIAERLLDEGHEVFAVARGREALDELARSHPAVLPSGEGS